MAEKAQSTALVVQELSAIETMLLEDVWEQEELSTDDAARAIVVQILAAETDDELEAVAQATPWQELVGVPVEVDSFRARRSDYNEGAAAYLLVRGRRLDTGEPVTLSTGGRNVIAALVNLARRGQLPAIRQLEYAKRETRQGFRPLWLVRPRELREAAKTQPAETA